MVADKIQKKYVMIIIYARVALSMGLEMMNSTIESLGIKDIAVGALLLVSIISVVIGVIVFRKYVVSEKNQSGRSYQSERIG